MTVQLHWRAAVVVILALGALATVFVATSQSSQGLSLDDLTDEPAHNALVDSLAPGDTHILVYEVFQRYGPIADTVMTDPQAGPERQRVTQTVVVGADGCLASLTSQRRTLAGDLVSVGEMDFASAEETRPCLDDLQERRESTMEFLSGLGGTIREDRESGHFVIAVTAPVPTPASLTVDGEEVPLDSVDYSGYQIPFIEDLTLSHLEEVYYVNTQTLSLVRQETYGIGASGERTMLYSRAIIAEVIQ